MKTLAPFRPRRWNTNLLSWPSESLFNRLLDWSDAPLEDWNPDMDLVEKPDSFLVKIEVPGMAPEDINVTLEGRELTVRGERTKEEVSEEDHYRVRERSHGSFLRSFTFGVPINESDVEADIVNGVLTVKVKKAKEGKQTHIKIHKH